LEENIEEVMKSLNSGVKTVYPDSVTEYEMDDGEFKNSTNVSEDAVNKETNTKVTPSETRNTLAFNKFEIGEIDALLSEISLAIKKEEEVQKEGDLLQALLLQKGTEVFYEERKNLLADIILRGLEVNGKEKKELLVLCDELESVSYSIAKEKELQSKEGQEGIKTKQYYNLNFSKMGQTLSASSNIMLMIIDFFEKNVPIADYKILSSELEEIKESHLFVEDFLVIS